MVLLGLEQVDRALVDAREGPGVVDLGDHLVAAARRVDDDEVRRRHAAQRDVVGGVGVGGPVPAPARVAQHAALLEVGEQRREVLAAERLAVVDRQLEGGALDVAREHLEVVRVGVRALGRGVEQVLGVVGEVLVEGVAAQHEHRGGRLHAPPRAPRLLAEARDRARDSPAMTQASSEPMSMPSSSAFVETTHWMRPARRPCSIDAPLLGQHARRGSPSPGRRPRGRRGRRPSGTSTSTSVVTREPGEDDRVDVALEERGRDPPRDREVGRPQARAAAFTIGGLTTITWRSPRGAPDLVTSDRAALEHRRGELAGVRDRGARGARRPGRCRRSGRCAGAGAARSRGGCRTRRGSGASSSITTTFRFSNSFIHRAWWGRIAVWSMSGLDRITCARSRTMRRSAGGVSPS